MAIVARLAEMQNAHGKNRLVIVLDGMGVAVMEKLLDKIVNEQINFKIEEIDKLFSEYELIFMKVNIRNTRFI